MQTLNTLILLALATIINSKLEVQNYEGIEEYLKDESLLDIPYSVANFGFAP